MNTKEKYEDIKLSLINEKTRDTLEKIRRATKDFTVQNDKADAYVSAVHSKLKKEKPEGLRSEDKKPEPKKPEPKKATTKPEPKPKPAPKPKPTKTAVKATTTKVNALTSALQNDPLLKGLGKTDKERDAGRTALPKGRRVSKAGWKNQYGSSKGGRVYYENRENHSDRKSPDYKDGYPYLAMGGYTHRADEDGSFYVNIYTERNGKIIDVKEKTYKDEDSAMAYAMMKGNFLKSGESVFVMNEDGDVLYKKVSMRSAGGYMADGGFIEKSDKFKIVQPANISFGITEPYNAIVEVVDDEVNSRGQVTVLELEGKMKGTKYDIQVSKLNTKFADGGELEERREYFQGTMSDDALKSILDYEYPNNRLSVEYDSISGTRIFGKKSELLNAQTKLKDIYKIKTTLRGEDKLGMPYLSVPSQFVYFANGGEIDDEGVDLFEDYEDQPEEVSVILSKYELEDNDYDILEQLLAELEEIGYTFEYGLDGEPYDLRKIGQKGKSEFYAKGGVFEKLEVGVYKVGKPIKVEPNLYEQKIVEIFANGDISTASDYGRKLSDFSGLNYPIISKEQLDAQYKMERGGYMAKGEDYEYKNTFKRFDSNVPVPQDDFKKFVDAWHKQNEGDKLDKAKYKVLKQSMGNYLGHKTVQEMEDYVEKTHKVQRMAKGGEIKKGDMVIVDNPYWKLEAPFKAVKRKVKAVFGDEVFFSGGSNSSIKYVKKYNEGGELDQGFNDRLDESMGNRDGKETKMEATLKDRRNEAKGENKAVGKRPYSSVHTMDKMAEGGKVGDVKLPHNLKKYFTKPAGTIEVEMNKLIPIRAREKGIANAERYMRLAYDGKMEKRKPISIYKTRNGKYRIKDGNSTYAVAKKHNWKTIFAEVVENPNISKRKENSVFTVASKIRKDGESWASAVKRAGAMNKK
jgi:hypothetical protein